MKKGSVFTCNGCLAFEHSVRICPPGSPAGLTSTKAYCGIGNDIEPKDKNDFRPVAKTCEKPKNISDYVKAGYAFQRRCMSGEV